MNGEGNVDAQALAALYQKPDFPQIYFGKKPRSRPTEDDDKEVMGLAMEIVKKLAQQDG